MSRLAFVAALSILCSASGVEAADPCDGQHEIGGSTWFLFCPLHSHVCGGGMGNLWGWWPNCCCDEGRFYDSVTTGVDAGLQECQRCEGLAKATARLNQTSGGKTPLENKRLPAWWTSIGLPPPEWLREHAGWMLSFTVGPTLLRAGASYAAGALCKRFLGVDLLASLMGALIDGLSEGTARGKLLLPGAWAYVEYQARNPQVVYLDKATIQGYRMYQAAVHGGSLSLPLVEHPTKITLVPADIKRMSYKIYRLSLGYPEWLAALSAAMHLFGWHFLQIFLYLLTYLAFCDMVDSVQLIFLSMYMLRQAIYLIGISLGCCRRPSFMLYHPFAALAAGGSAHLELASFIIQPEMWILKMVFVDFPPDAKPPTYYALLASTFFTDVFALLAFISGLRSGILPMPLAFCYLAGLASVVTSASALLFTDFFTEGVREADTEEIRLLRQAGFKAGQLRETGKTAGQLRSAGYLAEDLKTAGYLPEDLKTAGYLPENILTAGYLAEDLKTVGYRAKDLKTAGYRAEDLKTAGYRAKDLKTAGYLTEDLETAGYPAEDLRHAGYSAAELRKAGYPNAAVLGAGYPVDRLRQEVGFEASDLKAAGYPEESILSGLFPFPELVAIGYPARSFKQAGYNTDDVGYIEEVLSAKERLLLPPVADDEVEVVSMIRNSRYNLFECVFSEVKTVGNFPFRIRVTYYGIFDDIEAAVDVDADPLDTLDPNWHFENVEVRVTLVNWAAHRRSIQRTKIMSFSKGKDTLRFENLVKINDLRSEKGGVGPYDSLCVRASCTLP